MKISKSDIVYVKLDIFMKQIKSGFNKQTLKILQTLMSTHILPHLPYSYGFFEKKVD
jgi:hypothetical protein